MEKILLNAVRCKKCNEWLESIYPQRISRCRCGAVEISGGDKNLIRKGNPEDYEELAQVLVITDEENILRLCGEINGSRRAAEKAEHAIREAENFLKTALEDYLRKHPSKFGKEKDVSASDLELGTWQCASSPTKFCVYNKTEDPCCDSCLFCGDPDERK